MSNEDSDFSALLGHDASAAIRGFFYQINVTVLRWLQLPAECHLELEAGEDIDVVRDVFLPGEKRHRALEQIKDLKKHITLRSPEVLAPLGRFLAHQQANPSFHLEFHYLTTALVGQEQHSVCEEPLITYWSELRMGRRSQESACFPHLRRILASAPQPSGITAQEWQAFSAFFSSGSHDLIIDFIRKVRWDLAQPDKADLKSQIEHILVERSLCVLSEAGTAYARLVLYVMELLSCHGMKRLGGEDLKEMLAHSHERVEWLELILKVDSLTAAVQSQSNLLRDEIAPKISQIHVAVRQLLPEWASDRYSSAIDIATSPPEPVSRAVYRTAAVQLLLNELDANIWVAITGASSSGKTQLALQASSASGRDLFWINLKGRSGRESSVHLGRCLSGIAKRSISPLVRSDLREALSCLPRKSVLVIDDLPEPDSTDRFEEGLALLAHICSEFNITLLTTAARALSRYVRDRAPSVSEVNAPPFSDEDVISLLRLFKASDEHLKPWFVDYLRLITRDSPLLLRAAAQHCEGKGWQLFESIFDLLGNRFADDVNTDTIRLLNATVDEDTRELLYRLQAVGPRFNVDDVRTAASIAPGIAHPLDKLQFLNGIWIEQDSQSEYLISPRVTRLPRGNLSKLTERNVHIAVASGVLRKRVLDQLDVVKVVTHYLAAEDLQSALTILLLALRAFAATTESNPDDWIITSIWYETALPAEFSIEDRIELRTAQVLARNKVGKDARYATIDLFDLLRANSSISPKVLVPGAVATTLELMSEEPVETARLLQCAIRAITDDQASSPTITKELRLRGAEMLWGPGSCCRTNAELFEWFDIVFSLATDEVDAVAHSEVAYQAAQQLCDGIWDREGSLPEADRRWQALLDRLAGLTSKAIRAEARPLLAALVRARIIIMMDYLRDADGASRLAREVVPLLEPESSGVFLVASTIGQQYCFLSLRAEAEPWLDQAVELERHGQVMHRVYTFLYAGIVKASRSPSDSLTLIVNATEIALSNDEVPLTLRVRALGERAIALWRTSGLGTAYGSLRDAAEMLLGSDLSHDRERSLFRLLGNSLGYFMYAASGQLPSNRFLTPEPGQFLDFSSRFAGLFTNDSVWFLAMQVGDLAEALGHESDAARFAERALALPGVTTEARWVLAQYIITQKASDADYAGIVGLWSSLAADPIPLGAPDGGESGLAQIPIIAIGMSLAVFKLRDEAAISSLVITSVSALRAVPDSVPAADQFRRAADLIEKAYASDLNGGQLIELGNKQQNTAFHVISYLGAMFKLPPEGAFRALCAMLPALKRLSRGMYRVFVVPFVRSFWPVVFGHSAFMFSAPRLVGRQIEEALAIEGEASMLPLLAAVAEGLGVKAPEKI